MAFGAAIGAWQAFRGNARWYWVCGLAVSPVLLLDIVSPPHVGTHLWAPLLICFVPTLICWRLTRNIYGPPHFSPPLDPSVARLRRDEGSGVG